MAFSCSKKNKPICTLALILLCLVGLYLIYTQTQANQNEDTVDVGDQAEIAEESFLVDETVPMLAEKFDRIRLITPAPKTVLTSPVTIKGEAVGSWFFEADAPVVLFNWDMRPIGEGYITAQGDWMTEDFVRFEGELTFTQTETVEDDRGILMLGKANPSGAKVYADALEFEVVIGE